MVELSLGSTLVCYFGFVADPCVCAGGERWRTILKKVTNIEKMKVFKHESIKWNYTTFSKKKKNENTPYIINSLI